MKKIIFIFIFVLSFSSLAFSFDNEPETFRNIKWGKNISELKDMKIVQNAGDNKFYKRKSEKLKIGTAKINDLVYAFYKGHFAGVLIRFSESSNFMDIKEAFIQLYGEGVKSNRFLDNYWWFGSDVDINLEYSKVSNEGSLAYFYKPIQDQKKADKIQSSNNVKDDL